MTEVNEQLSAKRRGRKPGPKSQSAPAAVAPATEAAPARTPETKAAFADKMAAARAAKAAKRSLQALRATVAAAPAAVAAVAETVAETIPAPVKAIETIAAVASPASVPEPSPAETLAPPHEGTIEMANVAANLTDTLSAEKLQSLFGDMGTRFKASFEKSSKVGEDLVEFTKGNVEAVVASARVAAKGGEALGQDAAEYTKKSFESAVAAMKSFASVKSPTELFTLQSEYDKASFDSAVAEASKFSESMMKLAGDVAQPLSTRYAVAAEKIKSAAL